MFELYLKKNSNTDGNLSLISLTLIKLDVNLVDKLNAFNDKHDEVKVNNGILYVYIKYPN